jgi:hypothetical protein
MAGWKGPEAIGQAPGSISGKAPLRGGLGNKVVGRAGEPVERRFFRVIAYPGKITHWVTAGRGLSPPLKGGKRPYNYEEI